MREDASKHIPVNWLSKEDLLYSHPDLKVFIDSMEAGELEIIADKLGDALQAIFSRVQNYRL